MELTSHQRETFRESGFLILRGLLAPEQARRYFGELEALLRAAFGAPYDGSVSHWVPATDRYTPQAVSLLADERFRRIAEQLVGRPVLGEGTDGSYFVGDTGWHHDAVHPGTLEAIKFTLYGDALDGDSGALRFVPGSQHWAHREPLGQGRLDSRRDAWPSVVFDTRPGDAVVFDVRVLHGAFNGGCRLAGSVNYRIDPQTDREAAACREYFARSHRHLRQRYGTSLRLHPAYFRSRPDPHHQRWVKRFSELGVLDESDAAPPRSAQTALTTSETTS